MSLATHFIDDLLHSFLRGDPDAAAKRAEAANVRLLQRQYQAIAAGDFTGALAVLAQDAELEILGPPGNPFVGRWQGRDDIGQALAHNFSLVGEQEPVIDTLTAQGDTVVIVARERGVYRPSGRRYDLHFVQVFTFRDGKIRRMREIIDSAADFVDA